MRHTHGCGAWWTGLRTAHCGGCHQTFSGMSTFDNHRSPEGPHGSCKDPATLGLVEKEHTSKEGTWTAWHDPRTRDFDNQDDERDI